MNMIQFGIASIVDANTGFSQAADYRSTHTQAAEHRAHTIRAKSVIALFAAIKAVLRGLLAKYRERADARHTLAELSALDDRQLADIGLDRADLFAVGVGHVSLRELNARRLSGEATGRQASKPAPGDGQSGSRRIFSDAFARVRGFVSEQVTAYRRRSQQRQDLVQLLRMDERLLRDIGLDRGDVIAVEMGQLSLQQLDRERQLRRDRVRLLKTAPARRDSVSSSATERTARCA